MAAGQAPDAAAPRPAAQRPLPGAAPGGQDPLEAQDREIAHFATAWGLDFECVAALARQRPEVVQRMLGSFSPKETAARRGQRIHGFLEVRGRRAPRRSERCPGTRPETPCVLACCSGRPPRQGDGTGAG
ncbi:unnamed protein product, partial [Prorocentrum cordatum]